MTFTPEPYQTEAAKWLSRQRRGRIVSPAGSGKTLILAMALDAVVRKIPRTRKVVIGWIANTVEQCDQAHKAMDVFSSLIDNAIRFVHCAAAQRGWSDCDVLVIDECHHLGATGWTVQARTCLGAVWGMTATPKVGDALRDNAVSDFFQHTYVVDRSLVRSRLVEATVTMLDASDEGLQQLIDERIEQLTAKRTRQMRFLNPKISDGEIYSALAWQVGTELGIVANKARNQSFLSAASKHTDDKLIALVSRVEHAKEFALQLGNAVPVYAAMGKKKRDSAIADFKHGSLNAIVATSLLDEGADLPNARVLLLISGGRSNVKNEQRTGRVLRTHSTKENAVIYDSLDSFHPMMRKHAERRMALYKKLGYTIELPGASKEMELAL